MGGIRFEDHPRLANEKEIALYGLDVALNGDIIYICKGLKEADYQRARQEMGGLVRLKVPYSEAKEDVLNSLSRVSFGSVSSAMAKNGNDYRDAKNGRPLAWTAEKRCRMDLMKKLFPFVPGDVMPAGAGMVVEGGSYMPNFSDPAWGDARDRENYGSIDDINNDLFGD